MFTFNKNTVTTLRNLVIMFGIFILFLLSLTGISTALNKDRNVQILRKEAKWYINKDEYSLKYYLILREQKGNIFTYEVPLNRFNELQEETEVILRVDESYIIDNSIGDSTYEKTNNLFCMRISYFPDLIYNLNNILSSLKGLPKELEIYNTYHHVLLKD